MTDSTPSHKSCPRRLSPAAIVLGAGIGTSMGVALHNVAVGVAVGAACALAFTIAFQKKKS